MKRKNIKNLLFKYITLITVFSFLCSVPVNAIDYKKEAEARKSMDIESNSYHNWPLGPAIGAEAAILMDANTGAILYEKNIFISKTAMNELMDRRRIETKGTVEVCYDVLLDYENISYKESAKIKSGVEALVNGTESAIPGNDVLKAMRVVFASLESAASGKTVCVNK